MAKKPGRRAKPKAGALRIVGHRPMVVTNRKPPPSIENELLSPEAVHELLTQMRTKKSGLVASAIAERIGALPRGALVREVEESLKAIHRLAAAIDALAHQDDSVPTLDLDSSEAGALIVLQALLTVEHGHTSGSQGARGDLSRFARGVVSSMLGKLERSRLKGLKARRDTDTAGRAAVSRRLRKAEEWRARARADWEKFVLVNAHRTTRLSRTAWAKTNAWRYGVSWQSVMRAIADA